MNEPINQEDKKEIEEPNENLREGQFVLAPAITILSCSLKLVNPEVEKERQFFIGSKDSHF